MFRDYLDRIEKNLQRGNATEHTHRPALEALLEGLKNGITATNEPKRIDCGAPDFSVARGKLTIGYVEAKDVGAALDEVERSDQLKRYRKYLTNLVLTDGLEFRWYVDGEPRQEARLGRWSGGKLRRDDPEAVRALLDGFLAHSPEPVATPQALAREMARLTHMIREVVQEAFQQKKASGDLTGLRAAFAAALLPELADDEHLGQFTDMYAQTLAYGFFAARVNHEGKPGSFDRDHAAREIPKTNPLLRRLFDYLTGASLDDEPHVGFVSDLVQLLSWADMGRVLADFGKRTRQEDPVVHFYETFLQQYDPTVRELRGVYYTPEPVVGYIVRSVDWLLREKFDLAEGLASRDTVTITRREEGPDGKAVEREETHPKVLILDPACGTGTFLYRVVDEIRQRFIESNNAGMWPGYVRDHLLPRLFGFELLMAPYAVAHLKLGMQLAAQDMPEAERDTWAYDFESDERLRVYLTNTLEEAEREVQTLYGPMRALSDEARAAGEVKRDLPIMVVLGNPPYSGHSANRESTEQRVAPRGLYYAYERRAGRVERVQRQAGLDGAVITGKTLIGHLLDDYTRVNGRLIAERQRKWLRDDYVKFIRWGQWRIGQTNAGILAMVTNNGFLDNPTFRAMRKRLMDDFDEIYILNMNGSTKRRDSAPDGSLDQNVFDIQQGVSIMFGIKTASTGTARSGALVRHLDLWGRRSGKYEFLNTHDVTTTDWVTLAPDEPFHLLVPVDTDRQAEYHVGAAVNSVLSRGSVGIVTSRDTVSVDVDRETLWQRVKGLVAVPLSTARDEYSVGEDSKSWTLQQAVADVQRDGPSAERLERMLYRPFDERWCYYTGRSNGLMARPMREIMRHLKEEPNVGLMLARRLETRGGWAHVICTGGLAQHHAVSIKEANYVFPLYLYPDPVVEQQSLPNASPWPAGSGGRTPNLDPKFVEAMKARLGLEFVSDGAGDLETTFGPEDIFRWIYGVFHAPGYRDRYAEFLKIDFPRIPLTDDVELFRELVARGGELVRLHLLRDIPDAALKGTSYPKAGDNVVARAHPKYIEAKQRVRINGEQYFEGVPPEVWEFQVGGYQVLDKWLKDRRGRALSYDDQIHYRRIVHALGETIRLMDEIDEVIEEHGGWPLPGQVA